MSQIQQIYTAAIAGQAVTLTPKAGSESKPTHLGATTLVVTTVANPARPEFWNAKDNYLVIVHSRSSQPETNTEGGRSRSRHR